MQIRLTEAKGYVASATLKTIPLVVPSSRRNHILPRIGPKCFYRWPRGNACSPAVGRGDDLLKHGGGGLALPCNGTRASSGTRLRSACHTASSHLHKPRGSAYSPAVGRGEDPLRYWGGGEGPDCLDVATACHDTSILSLDLMRSLRSMVVLASDPDPRSSLPLGVLGGDPAGSARIARMRRSSRRWASGRCVAGCSRPLCLRLRKRRSGRPGSDAIGMVLGSRTFQSSRR